LTVTDPELAFLQSQGVDTGTIGGTMSFAHVQGRWVKRVYVDNLLQAITIKEDYADLMAQAAREERHGRKQ
jgi:hypothetical protein